MNFVTVAIDFTLLVVQSFPLQSFLHYVKEITYFAVGIELIPRVVFFEKSF
jgi:hypothetical protein